ncbi:MAG: hypothetical protein FJW69_08755, partial [Actinobacteria bacterium]|nr:hypothetical protein [Actinomycetota bacterium]
AYVYLGSSNNLSTTPAWIGEGDQAGAWYGYSVSTAGDVNDDGYSDIIVGAYQYDVGGVGGEGRACVYQGSSSGPSTQPNWTVQGDQESAFLGFSVGIAGDINNDGYSDVVISAYNYTNGEDGEGRAYVYLGSNITPPPTPTPAPTPVFGSWKIQTPLPQDKHLFGIWGSSSNDVFAVGDMGTILHYGGNSWSIMSGNTTQRLEGIWGSSPTDVFAVGENGTILHYNGSTWVSMDSGTTLPLRGVWGSSSTDVFAVGGWTSDIFHYDGTSWTPVYTSAGSFTNRLYDVWGSSSSDVFAVGDDFNPQDGMIMHYDGQSWALMLREFTTTGFEDVWGSSPDNVFAVGDQGVTKHYNGTGWTSMYATADWLKGVWGSSANNIFAVGGGGTIVHYDGYSWSSMSSGTTNGLQDVWGSSATDTFAVGLYGIILRYQLQQPTPTPTPTPTPSTTVTGITREVNGDILPGVSVTIDGVGTVVSDQSGIFQITVTSTGSKNVVARKDGFRDRTRNIDIAGLGEEFTVICNFQGQYGLIPNAPDMWYALDCVNLWLYPPDGDIGLDMWTALDAVNAWLYPVQ